MRRIERVGAQGDVMFLRVESIPSTALPVPSEGGRHILAHSETGHHHWTAADGVERFQEPGDGMTCYLRVAGFGGVDGASVVHARPFDTHETVQLTTGAWMVRRQREYTPEGFRRVED